MRQRVMLLSTVHPPTDPRIFYKIAPSLSTYYEVFCAMPGARANTETNAFKTIRLPHFQGLFARALFCHPVALWNYLRFRPDLVHIFVPELLPLAFLFQWLGTKVIYEVQENLYKKFSIKRYNNGAVYQFLFRLCDRIAMRRFHLIFTEHAYLDVYRDLAYPHVVIHNYASLAFIDANKSCSGVISDKPQLFYTGVISMERCFDIIVAALARLKVTYPTFHVHLFGPSRLDQKEMAKLPGFEDIRNNLTFYGYTDIKMALPFAQNATAGIALLKPVADYPESYTTKLFEYMSLGLPVITSDFPIYRDVVEQSECGFCISPYDSDALYEKLRWIIENPGLARSMGNNGRKSAEKNYNWQQEEGLLLSFYKSLLKSDRVM
ncbi:glycosyltransferase [Dyadobacter pollutisoli]|jgi:glycosyltransferase involved in cell wall biosynthesis|uniref:Glycosyltransferase n=1 Tax=Dyadobacter pollutisoli TaxID=2910158 RepID=A0A9E8SKW1_9BACT|nr:glycosyltransferase [Dyadobacter pollutisoli]WAC11161.1 glycosyltransferase [Dyadobacter pollutisoli]